MARFLAHWLILLAAWTLVIKFVFPIAYDAAHGDPLGTHIYWDFWWVIHLWLAWALLNRPGYTYPLALSVSVVEIVIIVTKFFFFFQAPDWTIWQTNWFINKVFVLACFVTMLGYLALERRSTGASSTELPHPSSQAGQANNHHLKWWFETLRLNRSKRFGLRITC